MQDELGNKTKRQWWFENIAVPLVGLINMIKQDEPTAHLASFGGGSDTKCHVPQSQHLERLADTPLCPEHPQPL